MNPSFQQLMADATRLTRTGDLHAATAAIQAALHGSSPSADADASVIDVEAREIRVERDLEAPVPPPRPSGDPGRFLASRYVHAAGTRDYKLYVPPSYRGQPLPLVVMLHGCTQNPDDFAIGTRMNEAAHERGFFALYPAQAQNANASRCWNWFKHNHQRRGRGEPALLADMTRDVVNRYGMDNKRVYAAGLSAGGAMAAILGEAYPDIFAAVGVHSGLPPRSATNAKTAFDAMRRGAPADAEPRAGAAPAIVFHGDQDKTVHPINGQQIVAARAGATTPEIELKRSKGGRGVTHHVYRDADGRVVAEHWVVHGAGHAWSGGSPRGSYTDPKGPDATEEMVRFFFARSR
jgi:poly(hydroxyalkanoate) depolymerase family esterase